MVIAAQIRSLAARHRTGESAFFCIAALAFAGSAILTVVWCGSMPAMEMRMPGDWSMSMTWMRMPGQTSLEAAASFVGMWTVMMLAMMLPSVTPALSRYRESAGPRRAAIVGAGYFAVWSAIGLAIFPVGVALTALEMRSPVVSRLVPLAAGMVVVGAGGMQFTRWKARHLTCCRGDSFRLSPTDAVSAWRCGLSLGVHCALACAGPTAILLVFGVMNLETMCAVAAAITCERVMPDGNRVARASGTLAIGAGLLLVARAVRLA